MDIGQMRDMIDNDSMLHKIYDVIRIVDPVNKTVTNYKNGRLPTVPASCHAFWGNNKICDNCIAIRAYNENRIFIKFEFRQASIYMITAVPYDLPDKRLVAELLMDVTNGLELNAGSGDDVSHIHELIDQLNDRTMQDHLTHVFNRRYVSEKLPVDLVYAAVTSRRLSVIMADIDHFKLVNDTYGHLAGDKVLIRFAAILSDCLSRADDWVARYGGEEFLICLPGAGQSKAMEVAERIRSAVASEVNWLEDADLRITASFGVCTIKPATGSQMDALIKCADDQLYLAKQNGRNRVLG